MGQINFAKKQPSTRRLGSQKTTGLWVVRAKSMAIILAIIAITVAIPLAIHLNWRFYFQNTLTASEASKYGQDYSPGILDEPVQAVFENYTETGKYKDKPIEVTYKAYYDITGTVVSVHDYWGFDAYNTLVPRDVCLAWGDLATIYPDPDLSFSQYDRFCYLKFQENLIDSKDITYNRGGLGRMIGLSVMSNNHLIPSTAEIRDQIFELKTGDVIEIKGFLVDVHYDDLYLKSSMSRTDAGDGACEVIYVTKVEKL